MMTKSVNISIKGQNFLLQEDAYRKLSGYIDKVRSNLGKSDADEIMDDFEARISEHLSNILKKGKSHKNITLEQVESVISKMGKSKEIQESYMAEEAKTPKKKFKMSKRAIKIIGGATLVVFALILLGIGVFSFISDIGKLHLSAEQMSMLSSKTVNEYFPTEVAGVEVGPIFTSEENEYLAYDQNITSINGKNASEEDTSAKINLYVQAKYNLEDPAKALRITIMKFTDKTELEKGIEINEYAINDAGSEFTEKDLKIANAVTWFVYKSVDASKAATVGSAEVRIIFTDIKLSININFGGGYSESEIREFVTNYINTITSDDTEYINNSEILTTAQYIILVGRGMLNDFSNSVQERIVIPSFVMPSMPTI